MTNIKQKRGKRHTTGIQVANNPLSRNLARIFAEREQGQMLTRPDGNPLVRHNQDLETKVQAIRKKIMENHDLKSEKGEALSVGTILGWIRPHKDNPDLCRRDPCFKYLAWVAEAIGQNPWHLFLEPEQVQISHLSEDARALLRKVIALFDSPVFLEGVRAIVDMHEKLAHKIFLPVGIKAPEQPTPVPEGEEKIKKEDLQSIFDLQKLRQHIEPGDPQITHGPGFYCTSAKGPGCHGANVTDNLVCPISDPCPCRDPEGICRCPRFLRILMEKKNKDGSGPP